MIKLHDPKKVLEILKNNERSLYRLLMIRDDKQYTTDQLVDTYLVCEKIYNETMNLMGITHYIQCTDRDIRFSLMLNSDALFSMKTFLERLTEN